eukprot:TRINITY_DN50181_c0_g1_i1.p1 TRINITY_DN50181_c0_g1~~TRINITY_DN50181_c0_g1_i1.p1  ORF type:complete len:217 (+),score=94.66 TRINITY_DN50181_c0_g1_i1:40-651(+)
MSAEDIKEIDRLLADVTSDRVKAVLQREKATIEKELEAAKAREAKAKEAEDPEKKLPVKLISTYSWEQKPGELKIRASDNGWGPLVEGCQTLTGDRDNIGVDFKTEKGILRLEIKHLEKPVKHSEMTFRFKKDYVLITVPKETEGTWMNLKESDIGRRAKDKDDDPQRALMNMMKNMYEDGDEEMKRTIGKAMAESAAKGGGF